MFGRFFGFVVPGALISAAALAIYLVAGVALERPGVLRLEAALGARAGADYGMDARDTPSRPPLDPAIIGAAAEDERQLAQTPAAGSSITPVATVKRDTPVPGPSATNEPPDETSIPGASVTPRPTGTARPSETPEPTDTPATKPTDTPEPKPTDTPVPTNTPNPCQGNNQPANCHTPTPTPTEDPCDSSGPGGGSDDCVTPTATPILCGPLTGSIFCPKPTKTPTPTPTPTRRPCGDSSGPGSGDENCPRPTKTPTKTPTPTRTPVLDPDDLLDCLKIPPGPNCPL